LTRSSRNIGADVHDAMTYARIIVEFGVHGANVDVAWLGK
jgi:hypothetical protein